MAHVVFLRAANVGGKNVFRPTQLVAALEHLDVTNIGAAGTFVIHGRATPAVIRREVLGQLRFEPEMVVVRGAAIKQLVENNPFRGIKFSKDLRGWVGALSGKPKTATSLPAMFPPNPNWSMRVDRVEPPFAMGIFRRQPGPLVFPANAVADALGVSMTLRWWETFERIANAIEKRG